MNVGECNQPCPPAGRAVTRSAPARGVSLVEMLAVMAILAILLGLAVPNMQPYIVAQRLSSSSSELFITLQVARSEAVRRGAQVVVRTNGADANWSAGWTMFVDADRNGTLDAGEPVLRTGNALDAPLTLYANANVGSFVAFDATGRLASAGGAFVVCHGDALEADGQPRSRAVLVNGAGRVRMALDGDRDGVPETDVGVVGSCTNP